METIGFTPLANDLILIPTFITAFLFTSLLMLSQKILKRLSRGWEYLRLRNIQRISNLSFDGCICYFIGASIVVQLYKPPPLLLSWFSIVIMNLFLYILPFQQILTIVGEAVLSLKTFSIQAETNIESVNFRELSFGLKKVSELTRKYNMRIPHDGLALAMTISLFKNKQQTLDDINHIIKWLKNPRVDKNFNTFCKVTKKYGKDSKTCEKAGITNESYWTFERGVKVLGIIIPFVTALLTIVIPIIIQQLSPP